MPVKGLENGRGTFPTPVPLLRACVARMAEKWALQGVGRGTSPGLARCASASGSCLGHVYEHAMV